MSNKLQAALGVWKRPVELAEQIVANIEDFALVRGRLDKVIEACEVAITRGVTISPKLILDILGNDAP